MADDTATALADAAPALPSVDLDLAQARAEAALFGEAAAVKVGRYTMIDRAGEGGMGIVWSAWDPELGRAVAIKLASSGDAAARGRAREEGRALARLSHPNVVPIYDVVEHGERVFLVMELVKGRTLRAAARALSAAQLVRAYRQAAEGLAAAHRAGLVHRDFKPDNAILGADGRVRVLDFGLAHDVGSGAAGVAGTPRYMAPEQRAGEALTPAVDQYALCVALREGVEARGPVPRWIAPIVARGTAGRAADRFPSMDALARALARGANRWRRRAAIALGAVVAGGLVAAFALGRAQQAEAITPCAGGPAILDEAWSATQQGALAGRLAGLATPYAADGGPRVAGALDRYRTEWLALHRASCLAHRRGEISADLLDRRGACLGRRRAALATIGALAEDTTGARLPALVVAAGALPPIAACADDEALLARVAPPPPGGAAEARAVGELLARVGVERDAGELDRAEAGAREAVQRAARLPYPPLHARALVARGRVTLDRGAGDLGAADFAAALREAIVVGDDPLAIEAYARRAFALVRGDTPDRAAALAAATDGLAVLEAIEQRAGAAGRFARALLHHNLGAVARARGDLRAAIRWYERARGEAAGLDGAGAIELTSAALNVFALLDDPAARAALADEVVAVRTRLLGPTHPLTLEARAQAAAVADDPEAMRRALAPVVDAMARYHGALGDLPTYRAALLLPAMLAGDAPAVRAQAEAILAAPDVDDDALALARAYRDLAAGEPATAAAGFAALGARHARPAAPWYQQRRSADALVGAALAALAQGDRAAARRALDASDAIYARVAPEVPPAMRAQHAAAAAILRARAR